MARRPRILFPGALYHVYNRGNDRHPVFRDDDDRMKYLSYLAKYATELSVVLIGYCLLTNHFHLFIRTLLANLPSFMHRLHTAYVRWYNKKRGRTGHLFTSRYQASLVQEGNYALELSRYIHLNPVKADLVATPEEWPWSSFLDFIGTRKNPILDTGVILDQFGTSEAEQHNAYKAFVLEGLDKGTAWDQPPVKAGLFLGDDTFIKDICDKHSQMDLEVPSWLAPEESAPSFHDILRVILKESGLSFDALKESAKHRHTYWRNMLIFLSKKLANASTKELSRMLGLSSTATSKAIYRFESKLLFDRHLYENIQRIVSALGCIGMDLRAKGSDQH